MTLLHHFLPFRCTPSLNNLFLANHWVEITQLTTPFFAVIVMTCGKIVVKVVQWWFSNHRIFESLFSSPFQDIYLFKLPPNAVKLKYTHNRTDKLANNPSTICCCIFAAHSHLDNEFASEKKWRKKKCWWWWKR